jgi:hypothetical protein
MSQARTISVPPPSANPLTAAMTGLSTNWRTIPTNPLEVGVVVDRPSGELLEIGARAERPAGPRDHCDAQVGVGRELGQRVTRRAGERGVDGVQRDGSASAARPHRTAPAPRGSGVGHRQTRPSAR